MTDFRSHFFVAKNYYSHLENMNDPPKNRYQYHLRGPTALFRCPSYCKHAPPNVNSAPNVNTATPTVNTAPPTVNWAPHTVNVYSRSLFPR